MRKLLWIFFAANLLFSPLTGCHFGPDPKEVASRFLQAVLNSNYEEAEKYATKDSETLLTALASLTGSLPPSEREKIRNSKIDIRNVQVNGDQATVTYVNSSENKAETLNLKKESGQWKVAFTKDYVMPNLNNNMPDSSTGNIILQDTTMDQVKPDSAK